MDIEHEADAVAGAVVEVQSPLPEGLADGVVQVDPPAAVEKFHVHDL